MVDRDTDRCARWSKATMCIRMIATTINRYEGNYRSSHVQDNLLATRGMKTRFPMKTTDGGRNLDVNRNLLIV